MATVVKTVPQPQPILPRMAPREDLNPFRIAQIQFDMAAEYLKLDPGLRQVLRTPKRVLEVSLPVKTLVWPLSILTGIATSMTRLGVRRIWRRPGSSFKYSAAISN